MHFYLQLIFKSIFYNSINRNGLDTDKESENSFLGLDSEEDNVIRSASGSSDRMCMEVSDIEGPHNLSILRLPPTGESISGVSRS